MFTSVRPNEGKSFVAMQVAVALAKLGYPVVLVDADLRKSQLISAYGLKIDEGKGHGITHYLAGKCPMSGALYESDIRGLHIMPVGHVVSNSLALLNTERFRGMIALLRERYDFVIVDAPPVGTIIDAAEIAKSCDGSVMVVRYNEISRRDALEAKRQIERSGCPMLGAVLNAVGFDTLSSKKYYNKSYYTHYTSEYYKTTGKEKTKKSSQA